MSRRGPGAALAALLVALAAPQARADVEMFSRLALPAAPVSADELLAQRSIEREWGPSEDSVYRVVDIPGWKAEGLALTLSAAVPGTGQLYVGENSGWAFLLLETAGWAGRGWLNREADRKADAARAFIGNPYDSTAGWSFERWRQNGGGSTSFLEALWSGDREAFYQELARDPGYVGGFSGSNAEAGYTDYRNLRDLRDEQLHRAKLVETGLWIHHLVAAIDAFRAARFHNLPLRQQYQLQTSQKWRHGRPELRVALLRRF